MPGLILASTSAARARMLRRAEVAFESIAPRVDEAEIRATLAAEGTSSRDIADALAEAKALKVSSRRPEAIVIGADQVLDLDGAILAKAETQQDLLRQLSSLSGRRHTLYSAVVAAENGRAVWRHVGEARMSMGEMSEGWLADYVARNWDQVRGSVGGYLVEGEGARLFDRIDGDTFTVMGLPLVSLLSWLALRGAISR